MNARKNTALKGRKLVQYAKAILESQGARVEVAANQIRWWKDASTQRWVPRSVKHDFFGVWDLLAVWPTQRGFHQVTTLANLASHREKILAAGPWSPADGLWAWVGGQGRHFRLYHGPAFDQEATRCIPPKAPVRPAPR